MHPLYLNHKMDFGFATFATEVPTGKCICKSMNQFRWNNETEIVTTARHRQPQYFKYIRNISHFHVEAFKIIYKNTIHSFVIQIVSCG